MMRRISEKAEFSRVYTNHSVRASCITKLADSGVPDSLIMATSGHKRAESIKTYNRPTEIQVRRAAAILDDETDSSMDAIDSALALATPHQLGELESLTRACNYQNEWYQYMQCQPHPHHPAL